MWFHLQDGSTWDRNPLTLRQADDIPLCKTATVRQLVNLTYIYINFRLFTFCAIGYRSAQNQYIYIYWFLWRLIRSCKIRFLVEMGGEREREREREKWRVRVAGICVACTLLWCWYWLYIYIYIYIYKS